MGKFEKDYKKRLEANKRVQERNEVCESFRTSLKDMITNYKNQIKEIDENQSVSAERKEIVKQNVAGSYVKMANDVIKKIGQHIKDYKKQESKVKFNGTIESAEEKNHLASTITDLNSIKSIANSLKDIFASDAKEKEKGDDDQPGGPQ